VRENCTPGSARGVPGNRHSYRSVWIWIKVLLKSVVWDSVPWTISGRSMPIRHLMQNVCFPTWLSRLVGLWLQPWLPSRGGVFHVPFSE
jgi:hypothetical protein